MSHLCAGSCATKYTANLLTYTQASGHVTRDVRVQWRAAAAREEERLEAVLRYCGHDVLLSKRTRARPVCADEMSAGYV